jgi:type IX secretion system PorP/SprF family membrane protein
MKPSKLIVVGYCLLIFNYCTAQQDVLYNTYPTNGQAINPAYAGSAGIASFHIMVRKQSLSLPQSGSSQFLSYNTPLAGAKSFLGFQAFNTGFGSTGVSSTGFNICTGYRYHISDSLTVAIAGQFSFSQVPSFILGANTYKSAAGLGVYMRANNSYLGIAMPTATKVNFQISKDNSLTYARPLWLTAGYVFGLQPNTKLKAGVVYQSERQKLDFNAVLWLRQLVGVGLWYSNLGSEVNAQKATILTADVQINKKFRLGLSYDFAATRRADNLNAQRPLSKSLGLYQFLLRYDFDNQTGKIDRFRYF